jgi:hypothetical protein
MMVYVNYISAVYRLKELEKTVTMLKSDKYSERGVPEMVLAQRDFVKLEKEYFGEECVKMNIILAMLVVLSFFGFLTWMKFYA